MRSLMSSQMVSYPLLSLTLTIQTNKNNKTNIIRIINNFNAVLYYCFFLLKNQSKMSDDEFFYQPHNLVNFKKSSDSSEDELEFMQYVAKNYRHHFIG